jgi:MoaD family protein
MKITINYNSYTLRKFTGKTGECVDIDGCFTLGILIQRLVEIYGSEIGEIIFDTKHNKFKVNILINGNSVYDPGYLFEEDDVINIFPFISGG